MPPRPTRRSARSVRCTAAAFLLVGAGFATAAPATAAPTAGDTPAVPATAYQTDTATQPATAATQAPAVSQAPTQAPAPTESHLAQAGSSGAVAAAVTGVTFLGLAAVAVAVTAGKRRKSES